MHKGIRYTDLISHREVEHSYVFDFTIIGESLDVEGACYMRKPLPRFEKLWSDQPPPSFDKLSGMHLIGGQKSIEYVQYQCLPDHFTLQILSPLSGTQDQCFAKVRRYIPLLFVLDSRFKKAGL